MEFWYAQNILMFVRRDCLGSRPLLRREFQNTNTSQLSMVHPKLYLARSNPKNVSLKNALLIFISVTNHNKKYLKETHKKSFSTKGL